MDLWAFVNKHKTSESKNANLTSIKGGKWNIPPKLTKQFYKELAKLQKMVKFYHLLLRKWENITHLYLI